MRDVGFSDLAQYILNHCGDEVDAGRYALNSFSLPGCSSETLLKLWSEDIECFNLEGENIPYVITEAETETQTEAQIYFLILEKYKERVGITMAVIDIL